MRKIGIILISILFLWGCSEKVTEKDEVWQLAHSVLERNNDSNVKLKLEPEDKRFRSGDSFRIAGAGKGVEISSPTSAGLLYGAFALQRLKAAEVNLEKIDTIENPAYSLRLLNHWDNLDGTVERGYAGHSLWRWDELPDSLSPRYKEYAEKCAEVGINGIVLNNVNASPQILSSEYLEKVQALADYFRKYGIRIFLSVNFASPMALGNLPTADPLDSDVQGWWIDKCNEIYSLIPDFGGFLVKANSEGQPGPCDYGRTHSEGANMLATALSPHKGKVMWRAFVYSPTDSDRAKQAYFEFRPLDGEFEENVIIQVKNGPIDFQPREPYSPLFGAMPATNQMAEFQITQEYLGQANHLAFLAPMWKEFFSFVPPGSLEGISGVANIGDNLCLTGNPLADANFYAFGRLAWNPDLSSEGIFDEWADSHLYKDARSTPQPVKSALKKMFLESRETVVDYMMPLGLHHIFAFGHHYGPEPWCAVDGAREDWLPRYYHKADKTGIGFDRSKAGSDAVSQYPDSIASLYNDLESCPEEYLLWFHHVPWTHKMKSGLSLWDELCLKYQKGVDTVDAWIETWEGAAPYIQPELWADVKERLSIQAKDARWWRDACLLYFGEFSGKPLPEGVDKPVKTLTEFKKIKLPISNYENPSGELLDRYR